MIDGKPFSVETPDGAIAGYDLGGVGPDLHFLHGNSMSAGVYFPFLSHLTDHFHVVASDIRGHGASFTPDPPGRFTSWNPFLSDLCAVIENRFSGPVIGVGHSMGAYLTYAAAATFPHLFSKLILVDPILLLPRYLWLLYFLRKTGLSGKMPMPSSTRRKKWIFSDRNEAFSRYSAGRGMFRTWQPPFISAFTRHAVTEDASRARLSCHPETEARFYETVPLNTWSHAKKIRIPTLILRGENSHLFSPGAAGKLTAKLQDARFVSVAGGDHFLPMSQPETCAFHIKDFLMKNEDRKIR